MDQNPYKTKKFKALFAKWNKKLEKSGHEEIENLNLPVPTLKSFHSTVFRKKALVKDLDQERDTFLIATHMLNTYSFKNADEKRVWELYCEGKSTYETEEIMGKKGFKRSKIANMIKRLKKEIR